MPILWLTTTAITSGSTVIGYENIIIAKDKEPFAHKGNNPGVHRSELFTELFPAEISRQLKTFVGKKDCLVQFFPDTLVQDRLCDAILVNDSIKGELSRTILYTFDTHDGMPLYRETENNPGHLGSQTVTVKYSGNDTDTKFPSDYFGETNLLKNYGEIFLRFREGTYASSDRVGQKSPEFSHKWGEHRFSSDQLKGQNCLLLFLDERGEFCKQALQIAESVSLQENLTPVILYIEKQPENIENRSGAIILEYTGKTASEYGADRLPHPLPARPRRHDTIRKNRIFPATGRRTRTRRQANTTRPAHTSAEKQIVSSIN